MARTHYPTGDVMFVPIWPNAGAPVNGTSGTFANYAEPGDLLVDTTNLVTYQNTNTCASPTWSQFGTGVLTASALHVDTGTKTASATSGAATLNKMAGVIASESLTTAAGADYTLTLTNSDVAAADQVFASVQLGTSPTGTPVIAAVTPAGSVVIVVHNAAATDAFNGTIKISFLVVKN